MHPSTFDFLDELMQQPIPVIPLEPGKPGFRLPEEGNKDIRYCIARLDLLHPMISGNKLFKLWYYLERCRKGHYNKMVTFGGAFSNHLHATAYAANRLGIPCTGIVRGESPAHLGPTLQDCRSWGMELHFVSRAGYKDPEKVLASVLGVPRPEDVLVIPEGGSGDAGIAGAALICQRTSGIADFTHIVCAVGTGTTIQGIDRALLTGQKAVGIPVLAIPKGDQEKFRADLALSENSDLLFDYSFGGYARRSEELTAFIKLFSESQGVPLDFVYTGKVAFAISDLMQKSFFPDGSKVLFLHTGGLQGNRSGGGC